MYNTEDMMFQSAFEVLEALSHRLTTKREGLDDEAEVERYTKAHGKLSSAVGMIREAYRILGVD